MPSRPSFSGSSPGFALHKVIEACNDDQLQVFIGSDNIELLSHLDITSTNQLAVFATQLILPRAADFLKQEENLALLVRMLPTDKSEELAKRFGIERQDLYSKIEQSPSSLPLPEILSFFGVSPEKRAPAIQTQPSREIDVSYGLFLHQRKVALEVQELLYNHPRKVVLHMPTGSGKTRTAIHLIADHFRKHESTLVCWLAQNSEILEQAAGEFEKAWQALGNRPLRIVRYWGSKNTDIGEMTDGFLVAGLAKMRALEQRDPNQVLAMADATSLVIIDEAHQAVAPTYSSTISILHKKRKSTCLLGLTATPGRTWVDIDSDEKLSAFFEKRKIVLKIDGYKNPVKYLIDKGYLAKPKFVLIGMEVDTQKPKSLSSFSKTTEDFSEDELEKLESDSARNARIIDKIRDLATRHTRIIVFAPSVKNARLLMAIMASLNYNAFIITSETGNDQREKLISQFKSNSPEPMILFNFAVLTTGFDVPKVSAAVIARPTQSLVLYCQMVGRAMRGEKAGGARQAEIVTVIDPALPSFGDMAQAFMNWEDVWDD